MKKRTVLLAPLAVILSGCVGFGQRLAQDDPYVRLSHFKAQAESPQGTLVSGGPSGLPAQAIEEAIMACEAKLEGQCQLRRLGEKHLFGPTPDRVDELLTGYETWMEDQARQAARSGNAQAANWLAYYLAERGKHLEEALEMVDFALETAPEAPAVINTKGWVLHKMGRHEEAEPLLIKAAQADPSAVHIKNYADNAMAMGKYAFAEKAYERALQASPSPSLTRRIYQRLQMTRLRTGRSR